MQDASDSNGHTDAPGSARAHAAAPRLTVHELYRMILCFFALFARQRPPQMQRLSDETPKPSWKERVRQRVADSGVLTISIKTADVRRWLIESGLVLLIVYITENAWQLYSTLHERAMHLHLVTSTSRGACLLGVWVLLITQLLSTVILAVPPAYRRTGPVAPSAFLALAVLLEVAAFGDLSDATTALGMLCFASAAALLAVFRHDSQQRDAALQVPVDGLLLRIEEHVRKFCTFTSTGILCPPMAALCIYSALCNRFWRARPALVEYLRARHKLALGAAALMFLLSAQDRDGQKRIARVSERYYDKLCMRAETAFHLPKSFRSMGDKKRL